MTVAVREFSNIGPCRTLGAVVRETAKMIVYRDRFDAEQRISKAKVHTEPCRCCKDHETGAYANWMD